MINVKLISEIMFLVAIFSLCQNQRAEAGIVTERSFVGIDRCVNFTQIISNQERQSISVVLSGQRIGAQSASCRSASQILSNWKRLYVTFYPVDRKLLISNAKLCLNVGEYLSIRAMSVRDSVIKIMTNKKCSQHNNGIPQTLYKFAFVQYPKSSLPIPGVLVPNPRGGETFLRDVAGLRGPSIVAVGLSSEAVDEVEVHCVGEVEDILDVDTYEKLDQCLTDLFSI